MVTENWRVFPKKHVNRITTQVNKITNISIFTEQSAWKILNHTKITQKLRGTKFLSNMQYTQELILEQSENEVVSKFKWSK